MLIDSIREMIPIKIRQDLGLWTVVQASKSRLLLNPYFLLLCGQTPRNLTLLPGNECYVDYGGRKVRAPRDGILAFIEVFQDRIYEKYGGPKIGDTVVDIGAYVGMFAIRASEIVGESGKVLAVEPSESNFGYLVLNVEGMENIEPYKMALSNYEGFGALNTSSASACHTLVYEHTKYTKVPVNKLDNLIAGKRVDFIKIDAEGSELEILEGGEETLKSKPRLAIGAYHNVRGSRKESDLVSEFLRNIGYRVVVDKGYVYAWK